MLATHTRFSIPSGPDESARTDGNVGTGCDHHRASGKHIELFLVDGTTGGLITAEILNWRSGHQRSAIGDAL
ncbi:hypothetical protein FHE65_00180 [Mumia zhuanghuii]|uniref:Uncharacterized protein n=1 Tax=Mumia zhuanghuii TaxID=2585211 RepID=A0A5C4N519_9ACTN|nr:hypothetical protein FHE65_00285 [Mumia zhuanghuii]TNC52690.1 hypothetical protein FHE65_00180 [Mumia zhuanghuii]